MVVRFKTPGTIHGYTGFPVFPIQLCNRRNLLFRCFSIPLKVRAFQSVICNNVGLQFQQVMKFSSRLIRHVSRRIPPQYCYITILSQQFIYLRHCYLINIMFKSLRHLCRIPEPVMFFGICINRGAVRVIPSFRC